MFDIKKTDVAMQNAVSHLIKQFNGLKVGVARPDFLDSISVNIYEQNINIKQLASVNVIDNSTLNVIPFDKSSSKEITRAIQEANLGVGVVSEGANIKIVMPRVTEERRLELVKIAKQYAEDIKVSIRNIRRDNMADLKESEKTGLSKNDRERFEKEVQKLTDNFIKQIDNILEEKRNQIMKV